MTCSNVLFISPDSHCKYISFTFKCYSASRNPCWPPDGSPVPTLWCSGLLLCPALTEAVPMTEDALTAVTITFWAQFASSINNISKVAGYPHDISTRSLVPLTFRKDYICLFIHIYTKK